MSSIFMPAALRGGLQRTAAVAATALLASVVPAQAAWVPEKPVEFVVPAGTGGGLLTGTRARFRDPVLIVHRS